jgi:hypothetical protein
VGSRRKSRDALLKEGKKSDKIDAEKYGGIYCRRAGNIA